MKSRSLAVVIFCLLILHAPAVLAFDHQYGLWKETISPVVNAGVVDYRAILVNPGKLKEFIRELGEVTIQDYTSWSGEEKMTFWINAYNAAVIQLVIDHYPVRSIKQIGLFGPWKKKIIPLLGQRRSLHEIENGILRKEFDEPRIHFALVCASLGCSHLRSYTPDHLEEQLESAATNFLNDPSKTKVDHDKKVIYISEIFKWYRQDFIKKFGSLENCIRPYLPTEKRELLEKKGYHLSFIPYNWSLNDKVR